MINTIEVGDIVKLGHYDNEAIQWRVIHIKKDTVLLMTCEGIKAAYYNGCADYDINWIRSTLRFQLNKYFFNEAFTPSEQEAIITTTIYPYPSITDWPEKKYKPTRDKIYILSERDLDKYLPERWERICCGSRAFWNSRDYPSDSKICRYWLRDMYGGRMALTIDWDGDTFRADVNEDGIAVRPALRIKMNDLIKFNTQECSNCHERCSKEYIICPDCGEKLEGIKEYNKGDTIIFGRYPWTTSGKITPISWLVLDKEDNELTLISKCGLDNKPYNTNHVMLEWSNSSLRTWLNQDFITIAFTPAEQKYLIKIYAKADLNRKYPKTPQGEDTLDTVTLLSNDEAKRYFSDKNTSKARFSSGWLRTLGNGTGNACYIDENGQINELGFNVKKDDVSVRPVIKIRL